MHLKNSVGLRVRRAVISVVYHWTPRFGPALLLAIVEHKIIDCCHCVGGAAASIDTTKCCSHSFHPFNEAWCGTNKRTIWWYQYWRQGEHALLRKYLRWNLPTRARPPQRSRLMLSSSVSVGLQTFLYLKTKQTTDSFSIFVFMFTWTYFALNPILLVWNEFTFLAWRNVQIINRTLVCWLRALHKNPAFCGGAIMRISALWLANQESLPWKLPVFCARSSLTVEMKPILRLIWFSCFTPFWSDLWCDK